MELAIISLVCGCGVGLAALLVAGALLRLAVLAANKLVGPGPGRARARSGGIPEWDWDDWDDEYPATVRPWRGGPVIPEPGTFKCMAIAFLTAFVFALGFLLTGLAAQEVGLRMWREETRLAVAVVNLPVAGFALTVLLTMMLPTGFWRAAMVAFVYGFILGGFVLFLGAFIFVVATVAR